MIDRWCFRATDEAAPAEQWAGPPFRDRLRELRSVLIDRILELSRAHEIGGTGAGWVAEQSQGLERCTVLVDFQYCQQQGQHDRDEDEQGRRILVGQTGTKRQPNVKASQSR
jgi:hypothetical protein